MTGWLPTGGITEDLLLKAIDGCVLGGIGGRLVFRGNGTAGDTGILARVDPVALKAACKPGLIVH